MVETGGELTAHLTTGAVIVYAIEAAKRSHLVPWLTADTKTVNRVVSMVLAAVVAFGINWNYDAATGTLMVTGLTAHTVAAAVWEFMKQSVVQQLVYDGVVAKQSPPKQGGQ